MILTMAHKLKEEGLAEGLAKGKEEGLAEGVTLGLTQGAQKMLAAAKLLKQKIPLITVAEVTGLHLGELQDLKKMLDENP